MVIYKKREIKEAQRFSTPNGTFYQNRIGFWGSVTEIYPETNTCTVLSDIGGEYRGVPIVSSEWVYTGEEKEFVTGTRKLPPIGARVFVLMPTQTPAGAFILCSGFARGEENTADFYSNNESEDDEKQNSSLTVTQSGWKEKENYLNGDLELSSQDDDINIKIIPQDKDDVKKEIKINAFKNGENYKFSFSIKEDGITFESNQPINITSNEAVSLTAKKTIDISSDDLIKIKANNGLDVEATGKEINFNCQKLSVNKTDLTVGV